MILTTLIAASLVLTGLGTGVADAGQQASEAASAAAQDTAPPWDPAATYNQGDIVSHNGRLWRANHFIWPGLEPGNSGAPPWWIPWEDLGPADGGESVEGVFSATGPWEVTTTTASVPGTPGVKVWYPANLGTDGVDHPILTWGNGTTDVANVCTVHDEEIGSPDGQTGGRILSHLASWGFVVGCAESGSTGSGTEILATAQWLVDQDGNPNSVFFDKLDTTKVGAYGHSQGASGVVEATIQSDGLITSTASLALVNPNILDLLGLPVPDFGQLDDPFFLVSGTADFLVSQDQQQAYFNSVAGPAAKGAIKGASHPGTMGSSLGYTTAWFKYTLEGDQFARSAFVATNGNAPEVSTNSAWSNWAAKNLP